MQEHRNNDVVQGDKAKRRSLVPPLATASPAAAAVTKYGLKVDAAYQDQTRRMLRPTLLSSGGSGSDGGGGDGARASRPASSRSSHASEAKKHIDVMRPVMHWFTLRFASPRVERAYQLDHAYLTTVAARIATVVWMVLAIAVVFPAAIEWKDERLSTPAVSSVPDGSSGTRTTAIPARPGEERMLRCVFMAAGAALMMLYNLAVLAMSSLLQSSTLACLVYMAGGVMFAVGSVIDNDVNALLTSCSSMLLFVIAFYITAERLPFTHVASATLVILAAFVAGALAMRDDALESDAHTIRELLIATLAVAAVVLRHHQYERMRRRLYIAEANARLFEDKQVKLTTEQFELRSEVFNRTLKFLNVIDAEPEWDLSSPIEKSLHLLKGVVNDASLPHALWEIVTQVIDQLSQSDLYTPGVLTHNADGAAAADNGIGEETTRWLFDLMYKDKDGDTTPTSVTARHSLTASRRSSLSQVQHSRCKGSVVGSKAVSARVSGNKHTLGDVSEVMMHSDKIAENGDDDDDDDSEGGSTRPGSVQIPLPEIGYGVIDTKLVEEDEGSMVSTLVSSSSTRLGAESTLSGAEAQIRAMLKREKLDEWTFDVFDLARLTQGQPLLFTCSTLFRRYNLVETFDIDFSVFQNFLVAIEGGYLDHPYHNASHGCDVTRTMHYFMSVCHLDMHMSDVEVLAAIIAACIHDYAHPGLTNNFLIHDNDERALLYNDRAVLENFHCSKAFTVLRQDRCNILKNLTPAQFRAVRKIIVDLVLATDLAQHFELLAQFKNLTTYHSNDSQQTDMSKASNRLTVLKIALKCADLNHSAKTLSQHQTWTDRISEEFYRQGDLEISKGYPVSPFMDRTSANLPQSQIGFLNFLVVPLYETFMSFIDDYNGSHDSQDNEVEDGGANKLVRAHSGRAVTGSGASNSLRRANSEKRVSSNSASPEHSRHASDVKRKKKRVEKWSVIMPLLLANRQHWMDELARQHSLDKAQHITGNRNTVDDFDHQHRRASSAKLHRGVVNKHSRDNSLTAFANGGNSGGLGNSGIDSKFKADGPSRQLSASEVMQRRKVGSWSHDDTRGAPLAKVSLQQSSNSLSAFAEAAAESADADADDAEADALDVDDVKPIGL